MKVNKAELLIALKKVRSMVYPNEELIPILTNFRFKDGTICAFNLKVGMITKCCITENFVVGAKKFYSLIEGLPSEDFDLIIEGGRLFIKTGKSNSILSMPVEVNFPEIKKETPQTISKVPDDFNLGLEFCLGSASKQATQPVLAGVQINSNYIVASNINQVAYFRIADLNLPTCIIPPELIKEILNNGKPNGMFVDANVVYFDYQESQLVGGLIEGKFPGGWEKYFEVTEGIPLQFNKDELAPALQRIDAFCKSINDEKPVVSIVFDTNVTFIKYVGQGDQIEETIGTTGTKERFSIKVNPEGLLTAIKYCSNCWLVQGQKSDYLYFFDKDKKYNQLIALAD